VSEGSTSVLLPGLLTGRFNAAILHLPVDDPEVAIEPLFAEDLVLVADEGHELANREEIPLDELAGHRLLLPPPGSALRRVLDRAAALAGVTLQAAAEIDGVRLLATLALDGHGAAIVPATAASRRFAGGRPPARVPGLPPRVVALAYPRRPPPSTATRVVFDVLHETIEKLAEAQPGVRLGSAAFPLSRSG